MAELLDAIGHDLASWWMAQPLFFVSTAPSVGGHVNVSPKGLDTLRILGPQRAAYVDLTGSGAETIAHVRENGRITLMACAFAGAPRISRIYGVGTVHELGTGEFDSLHAEARFPALAGARAIIEVAVTAVSTSCGYAVPLMDLVGDRDRLLTWAEARGESGLVDYRATRNATSLDGLPAFHGPSSRPDPST